MCPVCGKDHDRERSCADQPEASRVGQVICDKYRVTRLIGEGGMASVYEARHTTIDRPFALKFLHPWLSADEEWLERFQREASAGGSLVSEHITAILDAGVTTDGAPYILMELLKGEDLGQRLAREGSLKPQEAIEIVGQACHGLAVAHRAGVIHRDLKPENLFLCRRQLGGDLVKVLDFGIAKLKNASLAHATRAGMVMGTPYYMSPEQAAGRGGVDHRTDLYALGVMLYELLSGEKPFVADDHSSVMNRIVAGATPKLTDICPTLSKELSDVVQRAIAKRPEHRFQTAEDFASALLKFWPQTRRASRTGRAFVDSRVHRSAEDVAYLTSAEPGLTVRITGSRDAQLAPALVPVVSPSMPTPAQRQRSVEPPLGPSLRVTGPGERGSSVDVPDFGDHTEPDALLQLDAQLREDAHAAAERDAERSPQTRGAPRKPAETDATKAPRERENAGMHAAADELTGEDRGSEAPPVQRRTATEDDTPVPTSLQTVSLGRTLAPLFLGIAAITVLAFAFVARPVSESSASSTESAARPDDAVEATAISASAPPGEDTQLLHEEKGADELERSAVAAVDAGARAGQLDEQPLEATPPGRLNVRSEPTASLSVNGKFVGSTPQMGLSLPAGDYRLALVHPQHGRKTKSVKIHPDQLTAVTVRFDDASGVPVSGSSSATPAPATTGCTPGFYVDAHGVRRVKPECLKDAPQATTRPPN